ncbi:uncharacterized protein PHACADRAFT_253447 [Phanerochaete carnosa HHB-10118-sp]|uniref:Uncharacterized protein n=1 Tax=Phanerochaete carnosa (strain HHB-10118-sp) TaxID=650164 RepID=K5V1K4_PHACS|nr:uncharacterized protein PHACADRAFT_253447 [Phanerochaete carnosa HHB-10118-sp]EKM56371.1 hypothetical protein PHACADRAFT_253447 [Phanerochaete carnosa HHB-10118-sp]
MPALARTRPSIPVALLDGPRPLMQPGPRFAKILDREANRTQFRDEEDDWLDNDNLDEKLSSAIRSIAEPMDQTQEQRIASVRQCATLGRSWRGGLKTRNAIPAPFYTVRGPRKERRSTHLERYFDSGGQDTEPLSSAFSSYDAGIDDDDQETVRGEELGGQGRTVDYDQDEASASFHDSTPGGNEAEPGQRTTTTGECATTVETTVVSTKALPVPPPIIAASPRLGGSASALWGTDGGGQRAAGSPTLGSVRMGRGKRRSAAMGSPTSPRVVSFHRERCGIAVCNSARKRAGPTDVVA